MSPSSPSAAPRRSRKSSIRPALCFSLSAAPIGTLAATGENCATLLSGLCRRRAVDQGALRSRAERPHILLHAARRFVGIDVSDRDYVRRARNSRDFVLSEYLIERADKEPAMIAAYPALGKDGMVEAIILAPIELQWVERFARLIEQRKGASAFLLGPHGNAAGETPRPRCALRRGAARSIP